MILIVNENVDFLSSLKCLLLNARTETQNPQLNISWASVIER